MTVDERLRESLHRRAEAVEPSPDGWAAISHRIDRRQRRTRTLSLSLVAGMSMAAIALTVVMVTISGPDSSEQNVAATGRDPGLAPTTTYVPGASTDEMSPGGEPNEGSSGTAVIGAPAGPLAGVGGGPAPGPQPGPMAATVRNSPLWPETQAELDRVQAGVEGQPWWNDAGVVPSAYLRDRGLSEPVSGVPTLGNGTPFAVTRYTASGVSGWVFLSRYGDVYFVSGAKSDRIVRTHIARQGDSVSVEAMATTAGRFVVRTKTPGADWNAPVTQPAPADRLVSLAVAGPSSSDLIVQIRHEADDGTVGFSEYLLHPRQTDISYEGLHDGSTLGFGRLGPVILDETLANSEHIAGVAMTYHWGEYCVTLSTAAGPDGVSFISTGGSDRVDVIVVDAPGVRTTEGIGVGDTVADVVAAYPGIEQRLTDGRGRLVHRPTDPDQADYEMFFEVVDGQVAGMWSGREHLANTDEFCA